MNGNIRFLVETIIEQVIQLENELEEENKEKELEYISWSNIDSLKGNLLDLQEEVLNSYKGDEY